MTKELLGELELNKIYQRDCFEGLKLLPDNSIDLTVTSPPYDNLRSYNGYSLDFEGIAKELFRVTKHGGILVWVVGDTTIKGSETGTSFKQALFFKEIGFNLHDTMIYEKENPQPQVKTKRYTNCFEYMFIISKGRPNTCNYITEECKTVGRVLNNTNRLPNGDTVSFVGNGKKVNKTKIKRNIWRYDAGFNRSTKDKIAFEHPAIFPEQLAQDHILSWSNPSDIVLDPFMGSGTTAKMSILNNRKFIGFEISAEYVEIANKRLNNEEETK
jgi:DNA modification methylase